jgi:hypothetical protein
MEFMHHLFGIIYYPLHCLINALARRAYRKYARTYVDGIGIVDTNWDDGDDHDFVQVTEDALRLIQRYDPRRFGTVRREIDFIVNRELISGGQYDRSTRSCVVDFGRRVLKAGSEHYTWYLARYACLIVHEATHGRIASFGVKYQGAARARIERLCRKEERRFASHLPCDQYDFSRIVPDFDETQWHSTWYGSRWKRVRKLIERIRQSRARNEECQIVVAHPEAADRQSLSWDGGGTGRPRMDNEQ